MKILFNLYGKVLRFVATGPWTKYGHWVLIYIFKTAYRIPWKNIREFSTLQDFFLRDVPFILSPTDLVSPVEADGLILGERISLEETLNIKGLQYRMKDFRELPLDRFRNGVFWHFYLAPYHYHWVHSPCDGSDLKGFYHHGDKWPVHATARKHRPFLYSENERVSFLFNSPLYGSVAVVCVGALGVSALRSAKGPVGTQWTSLPGGVKKGEKLLAFELGSSVLLFVERPPASVEMRDMLRVGDALYRDS